MARLYIVTPPTTSARELRLLPAVLDAAGAPAGAVLHVRKPGASRGELAAYLDALPPRHRAAAVLHTHHDLAGRAGARGVHHRAADAPPGRIKAPPGLTVSLAAHTLEELGVCRGEIDYFLLAPIHASVSKPRHAPAGGLADRAALAAAVRTARAPVVALGGVRPGALAALASWGFAGAALLGAVWDADDPVAAAAAAAQAAAAAAWEDAPPAGCL